MCSTRAECSCCQHFVTLCPGSQPQAPSFPSTYCHRARALLDTGPQKTAIVISRSVDWAYTHTHTHTHTFREGNQGNNDPERHTHIHTHLPLGQGNTQLIIHH